MTQSSSHKLLGVVIPTLGTRQAYLESCMQALSSEKVYVVVVGPESVKDVLRQQNLRCDEYLTEDTNDALATIINKAVSCIPDSIPFVTWVGDDDVLHLATCLETLSRYEENNEVVLTYGDCDYIDESNRFLWKNQPGRSAARYLSLLPQRVSQPASFIRHSAWHKVGGLDPKYQLAFDYDLFIRLAHIGKFSYVPATLASYRWHKSALSVRARKQSVLEAFKVRQRHKGAIARIVSIPFEVGIVLATYLFGSWMRFRFKE